MRAGIGFDVHPFDPERPLVLGGVEIPDAPGLAGHSDADVLCHAVADAILGAAALGDLGTHFPDDDDRYRGISSLEILRAVAELAASENHRVISVDATLVLERPKVADHIPRMRSNLAGALGVDHTVVSVKATRMEGLGALGRAEGAGCMAVALLATTLG